MARKPRVELAGGIHHVWARGNNRENIYRDDADREIYLALLAKVVEKRSWLVLAYCLMDNHVHLLVQTPEPDLGRGMQWLHGNYAQDFNYRCGREGHLFQGRFGSKLVTSDEQLWHTAAYIVRNPVTAGLCERLTDWDWSSHRATLAGAGPGWLAVDALLDHFRGVGPDPLPYYREVATGRREVANEESPGQNPPMETPVQQLERWEAHGAEWRLVSLGDDRAIVDLCTCYGERIERIESGDPELLAFLRARERAHARDGPP